MAAKDRLSAGFARLVSGTGQQIRLRRYSQAIGSVWDDETVLTQVGADLFTSGIVLPIDDRPGSFEAVLVEQGKLIDDDQKLFVNGSLSFTGSELKVKVGLGSPVAADQEYAIIPDGMITPEVQNQKIYKKVFIRRLTIGSLIGE